ncbi:MAG TPA: hypothetical protein ENJ96_00915 [Thermodesulfatator atlanticus]|uniref:DUF4412 domain-containing protein n=1 Tax=Thermodesulfatator atlanticus TaxID=501497 RepID=A0A7V5NYA3_9BACT|nr:hypothetical protein [Thermodesulfatator atlanticus]
MWSKSPKILLVVIAFLLANAVTLKASSFGLFQKRNQEGYRIKYLITIAENRNQETFYLVYYRLGDKMRTDVLENGNTHRIYYLGDKSYSCALSDEGWRCFGAQGHTAYLDTFKEIGGSSALARVGTRKVAGQKTACYRPRGTAEEVEFCLNQEGLPLYLRQTAPNSTFEMKAVDYSLKVSPKDFELPAQPVLMEDLLKRFKQMGIPGLK